MDSEILASVFHILSWAEFGIQHGRRGPQEFSALQFRLELLAVLSSFVPRSQLSRIEEVARIWGNEFSTEITPSFKAIREQTGAALSAPLPEFLERVDASATM